MFYFVVRFSYPNSGMERRVNMMVNTCKLKAVMVELGFSQVSLASQLGMSKNTLNAKLNGRAKITVDEAKELCDVLGLTDNKIKCEIFLT